MQLHFLPPFISDEAAAFALVGPVKTAIIYNRCASPPVINFFSTRNKLIHNVNVTEQNEILNHNQALDCQFNNS